MKLDEIKTLDKQDPLQSYREQFSLPKNTIYLDGNSLGALPTRVKQRVKAVTEQQWGEDLISSWNTHDWVSLPQQVGDKIAPVIGANPGDVICCDSISVNLFKLLSAAVQFNASRQRNKIISSSDNFPTDLYIAQGLQGLLGSEKCHFVNVEEEQLLNQIDDSVAIVLVTEVNFRSGKRLDIAALTRKAHQHGALIVVDLAHSAGVMPIHLNDWQVDMAVGCTYKYLNGGPGAPAFVYVNRALQGRLQQPIAGWFGHRSPFEFSPHYAADTGIKQFLAGTPSVISMAAVDAALELFADLDLQSVRTKSLQLGSLFDELIEQHGLQDKLQRLSPTEPEQRGSQLSYAFDYAYELCQALIDRGVIADFRAPNYIRFGFAPLYNSFADIWHAVQAINDVIASEAYKEPRWSKRQAVT
ncbi:MAG: kynureninase [Idiomarina sp.]|uniref:kynureninase n=1 Tax=Idiomarina sp. TaxID=1874361 RepID=UPI000C106325|nr:kynureninase [Idiomarina sp.]MBL4741859.1 kynureninase [Idiomarina sp.]MBT43491.1 kynureninase [Idiomarina sp.]PHQ77525.1 MAG: kynureninase [Idiomarina sp.]